MKKQFSKKLTLGKRTVANLSRSSMAMIRGGETNSAYLCGNPATGSTCGHSCRPTDCDGGGTSGNYTDPCNPVGPTQNCTGGDPTTWSDTSCDGPCGG